MGFFVDDISWCYNSMEDAENKCDNTHCFRHLSNRKSQPQPDIYTISAFKDTEVCPYYKENKDVR